MRKYFLAVCQGVKKGGFTDKKCIWGFCLFMLEKAKKKRWTILKRTISKNAQKNSVFGWLWRKKVFFLKMAFFRKISTHYLCSEGQQRTRIFVETICFGKMVPFFCGHCKRQSTIKLGLQQAQGKTLNGTFACKNAILGRALERGLYYLWSLEALFAENTVFIVLSAKHSFADMRECSLTKTKI